MPSTVQEPVFIDNSKHTYYTCAVIRVLIVHNTSALLEEALRMMTGLFDRKLFTLRVVTAKTATVPDFTWSDLMIVGTDENTLDFAKGEFREVNRAFRGINFAGKTVGFFFAASLNSKADSLARMFEDTDISVFPRLLSIQGDDTQDYKSISSWITSLCGFYKENEHE